MKRNRPELYITNINGPDESGAGALIGTDACIDVQWLASDKPVCLGVEFTGATPRNRHPHVLPSFLSPRRTRGIMRPICTPGCRWKIAPPVYLPEKNRSKNQEHFVLSKRRTHFPEYIRQPIPTSDRKTPHLVLVATYHRIT